MLFIRVLYGFLYTFQKGAAGNHKTATPETLNPKLLQGVCKALQLWAEGFGVFKG